MPDDSSSSAETNADAPIPSWPLPESEIADAEALLIQLGTMIAQTEQTLQRAKTHLAVLSADAPPLRQSLLSADAAADVPQLAELKAARGLRAELVKAAQQTVTVSQVAARYLQAREQFLINRRAWAKRAQVSH